MKVVEKSAGKFYLQKHVHPVMLMEQHIMTRMHASRQEVSIRASKHAAVQM